MICVKEAFGAGSGEVFDDVGVLAAAVVALAGIALCVFVGEYGACGFEDGAADEVFRGDHLEAFVLALYFVFNLCGDLGVGGGQRGIQVDGHGVILCHGFDIFFCELGFLILWGVLNKSRFLMWCFCDEVMVDCVAVVVRRRHVTWSLKTCHSFEIYFAASVEER